MNRKEKKMHCTAVVHKSSTYIWSRHDLHVHSQRPNNAQKSHTRLFNKRTKATTKKHIYKYRGKLPNKTNDPKIPPRPVWVGEEARGKIFGGGGHREKHTHKSNLRGPSITGRHSTEPRTPNTSIRWWDHSRNESCDTSRPKQTSQNRANTTCRDKTQDTTHPSLSRERTRAQLENRTNTAETRARARLQVT